MTSSAPSARTIEGFAPVTYASGGAGALRGSHLTTSIAVEADAHPRIEGNAVLGGVGANDESRPIVVDNELPVVWVEDSAFATVDGNTIDMATRPDWMGLGFVIDVEGIDAGAEISNNVIQNGQTGVCIERSVGSTVSGNDLSGHLIGIHSMASESSFSGNTVRDSSFGMVVDGLGAPAISGSTITGSDVVGLSLHAGTQAILSGNTVCDNTVNYVAEPGAAPTDDGTNEICADGA